LTPEQCTRVFEAFYRTDRSRDAKTGGTGLGLYLVKGIAEGHGGTARAMPREGGGLTIELRLPVHGQREQRETVRMQVAKG
jgi:signal transduction histidine kinase